MADHPNPDIGVQFPMIDGRRSTTATGRTVFAAAAEPVDPRLARRIRILPQWRKEYLAPARDLVALAGRNSSLSFDASAAGLASLTDSFVYVHDGEEHPLAAACDLPGGFATHSLVGWASEHREVGVPYRGRDLTGSDLNAQVRKWVAAGVAEPSFQTAMATAVDHPEWFDLSRTTIVMLGAGAELSPLRELLSWGAQVIAVDLPRPDTWRRILASVRGTPGVLHVPVPRNAGIGPGSDCLLYTSRCV